MADQEELDCEELECEDVDFSCEVEGDDADVAEEEVVSVT